jgi:hemolysin D
MPDERTFATGEYLFREGESGVYGYIIKSGRVVIVKSGLDGERVLGEFGPGSLLGEMALIDGDPRSASARAEEESVVTEISSKTFNDYIRTNPSAARRIMETLAGSIRTVNNQLAHAISNTEQGIPVTNTEIVDEEDSDNEIEDTDAIYNRPPSRLIVYSLISVLSFLLFSLVYSYFSHVDTVISARGKFTTKTPNISVQASSSSVIVALMVERGQTVEAGQIIALLDGTIAHTTLQSNSDKSMVVEGRLSRLRLENEILNSDKPFPDQGDLSPLNYDILTKRVSEYQGRSKSFTSKINKLKHELNAAVDTVNIVGRQKELKQKLENVQEGLYDKGHTSLLSYLTAADAALNAERSVLDAQNNFMKFEAELDSIEAEEKAFMAQWSSALAENIAKDEEIRSQLLQERILLQQAVANIEVRAPAPGIVLDLPLVAVGSIVQEGDEILTLVQTNQPLALEVDIDPSDISNTKVTMPVSVKLDALPFQKFGDLKGELVFLSQDTFSESLSGEKGAFYRGRIDISGEQLQTLPPDFQLTQGMLANADIKVGKRRVITYFTFPIIRAFEDSFREPD